METWEKWLKDCGYSLKDVYNLFEEKKKELENKRKVYFKDPTTGYDGIDTKILETKAGRFVTRIQKTYPIKMLVLQELEGEVRIGYYVVSLKKLREKKQLSIVWGQFNPHIPKDDLRAIIEEAKKNGIL
ncbi:MAG: hypothetical protein ACTSW1_05830 [Candidatus Hodarchaeales archaeon]